MGRMPSAQRRRQLVEAAIRVMARDGVAKTTTRSVVAEAGVSLSVFHYCFDSKQELLEAVVDAISEHSESDVLTTLIRRPTLRETVRAGLQAYWDHVLANPGEHMLTYELTQYALREPGYEHLARRQYEGYLAAHTKVIRQLPSVLGVELTVPEPEAVRYLAALTDGLTLNFLVLGDEEKAGAVLDIVADQILTLVRE
ncbi:TetR/AcrR family transcriptional regulator [Streptomyces laculatispora]|uniref:TetR/AcrR family transcriptional regulator n=1 Tax=Streptomyces laculatispora TaxID=887464 RepID=A0ABY9ICF4_9ACTN|nr:TetR/AcrR family transcriptional regulator [Streptomyces laculatispora]WLQ44571.1 TetR/AcrR family transcriptional regulator [Streptomyces laculatispora]